ncbi:MAG: sulfatase-like hydrolase/transferase [Pirellulaceae bacterium]
MCRIVQLIDRSGLRENTLIVFTSDNGGPASVDKRFRTNGRLRGFKRDLSEGGIRVPFIARWPGTVPADQTCDEVIAFQDILPTFAEMSGAILPDPIDGVSVLKVLKGEKLGLSRSLYWDFGHCRERYDQAIRWNDWKGIRLEVTGQFNFTTWQSISVKRTILHRSILPSLSRSPT